jgi:acetolactate decarboxylase
MRRILTVLFAVLLVAASSQASHSEPTVIYQISTLKALKQGVYDGRSTFYEIKEHGDLGMGTLNGLDGEMIALDGEFFQIKADGKAYPIPDAAETPFAMVTFFKPTIKQPIHGLNSLIELEKSLDSVPHPGEKFGVIRIDGNFKYLKVRSVARQEKPYPGLEEALKNQTVFELNGVRGTLIGFCFPSYIGGVNVAGYHFHFITHDRKAGGHVLECSLDKAEVQLAYVSALDLRLIEKDGH